MHDSSMCLHAAAHSMCLGAFEVPVGGSAKPLPGLRPAAAYLTSQTYCMTFKVQLLIS